MMMLKRNFTINSSLPSKFLFLAIFFAVFLPKSTLSFPPLPTPPPPPPPPSSPSPSPSLFIFSPMPSPSPSPAPSSPHSLFIFSPTPSPSPSPSSMNITVVAYMDETSAVDLDTGETLLTFDVGSSFSWVDHNFSDYGSSPVDIAMYGLELGNGSLRMEAIGEQHLTAIVEDLYDAGTPFISQDKIVVRRKEVIIFKIDLHGRQIKVFDINANYNTLSEESDKEKAQSLYVIRTNYEVLNIPGAGEDASWKLKYSRLEAYLIEQGREQEVPVLYIRDAAHVRFLHQISNCNHTAAKPFLANKEGLRNLKSDIGAGSQSSFYRTKTGHYTLLLLSMGLVLVLLFLWHWIMFKNKHTWIFSGSSSENGSDNRQPAESDVPDATELNADTMTGVTKVSMMSVFSDRVIVTGSNGIVVLEGEYDTRKVSVKRFQMALADLAKAEEEILTSLDPHPNIVLFYGSVRDKGYVYLALERCICNLDHLITMNYTAPNHSGRTKVAGLLAEDLELWKGNGDPTHQLLDLIRDIISGLANLHGLGIIHRDLNPQNIYITKGLTLCAKVSGLGISQRLPDGTSSLACATTDCGTKGWCAPEILDNNGDLSKALDLFSLGCVIFFCMTKGKHPFGSGTGLEENIRHGKKDLTLLTQFAEAKHLCALLLDQSPEKRPSASDVLRHPLFWNAEKCIQFFREVSDQLQAEHTTYLQSKVDTGARHALNGNWTRRIRKKVFRALQGNQAIRGNSTCTLLRAVRNKCNHPGKEGDADWIGPPDEIHAYFTNRFPKLLIAVYTVMHDNRKQYSNFAKYFEEV